jgi:hypothetical protein
VFDALWRRDLAFKLGEEARARAFFSIRAGANLCDPNPARDPRRTGGQGAADHSSEWNLGAKLAHRNVSSLPKAND